ncbi:MAG: flagellin [Methanolinea sp.]|jgi:flagellar protein FlaG|nr:flagellin [Methanolinea sp.]
MSSETIVTALFLISAVIAAGVLINAIFPAIYRTADTFGSVSHEADTKMRTDFKIVNTFAQKPEAKIWLKNVGSARLHVNDIDIADIFIGSVNNFERFSLSGHYDKEELQNNYWDPGETLSITVSSSLIPESDGENMVYVAVILPNGVRRSEEFPPS